MTRFSFASLRVRLIFLVLFAVIPALGLVLYSGLEQRQHTRLAAYNNAFKIAKKSSDDQEQMIERTRHLLMALAQIPQVFQCQSSGGSAFLADLMKEYLSLLTRNRKI